MLPATATGSTPGSRMHACVRLSQHARQEKAQLSTMKASFLLHSPSLAHCAHSSLLSEQRADWHAKQLSPHAPFM